jgi:hypothetical protein
VLFFIDTDRIFLTQGQLPGGSVIGESAVVDTNDDFHTYRIEISAGSDRRVRRAERHFALTVRAQNAGRFRLAIVQLRAAFAIARAILD